MKEKLIIYQLFPRVFSNTNATCKPWGTLAENGSGHLSDLKGKTLKSLKDMGVNCLWLTGVIENATKTAYPEAGIPADNPNVVKGEAGSPYAIKDYYDVAPCLAADPKRRMPEFEAAVKRIHDAGMTVIIDFVPNHTARVYHSDAAPAGVRDFGADDNINMFFDPQNNYYYCTNQQFAPHFDISSQGDHPYVEFPAKATGNDCFTAFCGENDWYETVKLNYGVDYFGAERDHFNPVPDTWNKMYEILRFWASKGIDGFRCDMVFMVPLAFWHWVIPRVKYEYPDLVFIGEIYDVGQYRPFIDYGCFDYLYDKVNLYDTLVGIERMNWSAAAITGCWQSVDGIGDKMLNFLENHDEVRFASPEFAGNPLRVVPYLVVSATISTGPFMIYYGQELGDPGTDNEGFAGNNNRTTIFDYWSLDTVRRWYNEGKPGEKNLTRQEKWLRSTYSKVLRLCNSESAIREGRFFDLMYVNLRHAGFDPHRQFAYLRHDENQKLLIVANFSDEEKLLDIVIPASAFEHAGLPETEEGGPLLPARDLLWGDIQYVSLRPDAPTRVRVSAMSAVILDLPLKFVH